MFRETMALAVSLGLAAQGVENLRGDVRFTGERWRMPFAQESMDLLGLQIHRTWRAGGYAGLGGWGAVRGERGGFITLGFSGGWRFPLTDRLALDTGAWFGGGGAGRAAGGGGLMLRGHAGLSWDAGPARFGAEWSRVRFPNGRIESSQWALTVALPFRAPLGTPGLHLNLDRVSTGAGLGPLGWEDVSMGFTAQRYAPARTVKNLSGQVDTSGVGLTGLEVRLGLGKGEAFWILDLGAAAQGSADGYMEALLGVGYGLALDAEGHALLVGRLEGGPAGGGNLSVGGGMAWKGLLGLEARSSRGLFLNLSGGYLATPGGTFKGSLVQFEVGRRFQLALPGGGPASASDPVDFSGWSFRWGAQRLAAPQRRSGAEGEPIQLASLQVTHELSSTWFFVGQGNFGLTGHAGGFAVGLIGLGWRSGPLLGAGPRLRVHAMTGAAGGGGVDTGGGLLVQPMAGLEQDLGRGWSLQVMGGQQTAPKGRLRTSVAEAGLAWRFGLPERRR
ncbi:MAG: hypothetical protein HY823_14460 [Acidobacteria bacterium]|nr:hypothetical protein [Acidobacteriota bacterium]